MKKELKAYSDVTIKKLEHSEVEIIGSIPAEVLELERPKALKKINEQVSIPGFRKGMVPEKVLASKVGEMTILEEMGELALGKAYLQIVTDNKLDVIARPRVEITKLAKNNPLEFKIKTALLPEVKLPDYKKIAATEMKKSDEKISVTEKEIEDTITQIRKSRVDHSDHDHTGDPKEHDKEIEKMMPELTDDFVQGLGDFKNVDDFKAKIKEGMTAEKTQKAKDKKRMQIAENLVKETPVDLPEVIVQSELDKIEAQFNEDIARMGVKMEDYLKHLKKTIEDFRKEWRKDAEKKATFQLILNEIAVQEKIVADKDEVEKEVSHILAHYKDADPERARVYASSLLTNEKIFQFLENQK